MSSALASGSEPTLRFLVSFDSPAKGDLTLTRVWVNGEVTALGDGSTWVETLASPRIALPRSMGFAGAAVGFGIGMLITALAGRRLAGSWLLRHPYMAEPGYPWKLITIVCLTPAPAFFVTISWFNQPVWLPLALDVGTATVAVTVMVLISAR